MTMKADVIFHIAQQMDELNDMFVAIKRDLNFGNIL